MDFLGYLHHETIDCRTKEGRIRYEQLFRKNFPRKKRRSSQQRTKTNQRSLLEFIAGTPLYGKKRRKRAHYKRHYNPIPPNLQKEVALPVIDQLSIKSKSGYMGSLYQLFIDAELSFFAKWQQQQHITIFSHNCQIDDIIRLELARIRLGFPQLSTFLSYLSDWDELRIELGIEQKQIPSQPQYIKILKILGPRTIKDYFLRLQTKCEQYQLYDDKEDIWDARFLFSYNSGCRLSKNGDPFDPKLGVYVHQSKYFGIGYLESRIINFRFKLPKYYELVNPQWNDNQTFQYTFMNMIADGIQPSKLILADGGPKGKKTKDIVRFFRSDPIFPAQKNAAGKTLITKKSRLFYAADIPLEFHTILDSTYDHRTTVEESFAYDKIVYNLHTLPHYLPELCEVDIGLVNCEALLTAIAATQTNQFDLISTRKSFRRLGLAKQDMTWEKLNQANSDDFLHSTFCV